MRIRKRFPPPSDPQLSSPVMVQLNTKNKSPQSDLPNLSLPQPSDQPAPKSTTSWVLFGGNNNNIPAKLEQKDVGGEEEEEEKLWKEKKEIFGSNIDNDNKEKLSFLSTPQLGSLLPQPSSSSNQVDGRWCEEDHKVIPLKKRSRDNYHHHNNTSNINTMKSKTNKKCPQGNGNEEEQEHEDEHYRGVDNISSDHKVDHHHHHVNKKNKRGSVILEGSRCSRVNGRGWRCCQQTLVGYSLCEHHLGKGKLRSMNNNTVRNSMNKKKKDKGEGKKEKCLPNDYEYYGVDDDDEDDKKKSSSSLMATTKKKMKKLGMVKARSLSSLLGQTDNAVAMMIVDNDNKNE